MEMINEINNKYINLNETYIFVKSVSFHNTTLNTGSFIVLKGPGFELDRSQNNSEFTWTNEFTLIIDGDEFKEVKEITKNEYENILYSELEAIKNYKI